MIVSEGGLEELVYIDDCGFKFEFEVPMIYHM
jgi:hypothetical protein